MKNILNNCYLLSSKEEMEKKSRLRGPNFTKTDSLLLLDIINAHKTMIDCKKTDGASLLEKNRAWQDVLKTYNFSTTGPQRTLESLQQNYKNLKKKLKKPTSDVKLSLSDIQNINQSSEFEITEDMPEQSVSMQFMSLASAKLELVALQRELLETLINEEKEKIEHNRTLREMEMEDARKKFEHNELLRTLELENRTLNLSKKEDAG